jgi:hypothetical protein
MWYLRICLTVFGCWLLAGAIGWGCFHLCYLRWGAPMWLTLVISCGLGLLLSLANCRWVLPRPKDGP